MRCAVPQVERGSSGDLLHSTQEPDGDAGPVFERAVAVVGEGSTAAPELVHLGLPEAAVEIKYDRGRPLCHLSERTRGVGSRALAVLGQTAAREVGALSWRSLSERQITLRIQHNNLTK